MPSSIHPTAIVESGAELGRDVTIGPYSIVEGRVRLGDDVRIGAHVHIKGNTRLGDGVQVFSSAVVGEIPQDLKYGGEDTALRVGPRVRIREHATLHLGTAGGTGVTRVGADSYVMVGAHIAHDCIIGKSAIVGHNAALAGHVELGDFATVGGCVGVHQFCRIGSHALVGALSGVFEDVIPYGLCRGNRAALIGLNRERFRRQRFPGQVVAALDAAYRCLFFGDGTRPIAARARQLLDESGHSDEVAALARFVLARGARPVMRPEEGAARGR